MKSLPDPAAIRLKRLRFTGARAIEQMARFFILPMDGPFLLLSNEAGMIAIFSFVRMPSVNKARYQFKKAKWPSIRLVANGAKAATRCALRVRSAGPMRKNGLHRRQL
jgi:hypothetical protein